MRPFRLRRRALLRGLGAALALPVLDAMLDGRGRVLGEADAQCPAAPVRLVTFLFPHGVKRDAWTPAAAGAGYALTPCLEPLAAHRADFTVITGLANGAAGSIASQGGPHSRGAGSFGNGMPTRVGGATGPTVECAAAATLGGATRLRSLAVCADPAVGGVEGGSGVLLDYTSWTAGGVPVPPERDPRRLFARLVGASDAVGVLADPARRASVLDGVLAEVAALRGRAGAADRARLDEHLASVRDLEREVTAPPATCAGPEEAPGDPGDTPARARLMMRLVAMALRCDLTRFVSFALGNGIDTRPLPWLGLDAGHHEISHTDDHDTIVRIVRYEMEQVAYFLGLLRDARAASGSLLDASLVLVSSEVGDGATHAYDGLPVLLAGRAGGRARTGMHVRYPEGTPICNLYLTLLRLACAPAARFGLDGTAVLHELLA